MKLLILSLILPSLILGINAASTENNWEQDESFTLSTESSKADEKNIRMRHGPVEVSLSGPFETSTVPTFQSNGSSTTVDPIMSLIIKTLLEDHLNNEVNPETNNTKTPLSYMTPPSLVNKQIASTKSSSSEEFDDATSTTTMSDDTSTTTDSSENDDSAESSTPATIMAQNFDNKYNPPIDTKKTPSEIYDSQQKEQNEEYLSTTGKPLTIEQYAERYQDYLPQVSSEKPTAFDNVPPEEAPYENDNEESVTSNNNSNNLQPPHANNQMDQVIFNNPSTQTDQEQEEMPNPTQSQRDQSTNNVPPPSIQDQSTNSMTTTEPPLPVYYVFLKPRVFPNQRDVQRPFMMSPIPQPYSAANDPWLQYPERRLTRLPFIAQDYDRQQVAAQASLNMPYRYNNYYYSSYPYNYNQQFQTQFMSRPYYPIYPQMQNYYQNPMMGMNPYSRPYYSSSNNYYRTSPYYNYNNQYSNFAYPQTPFIGMTN